MLLAETVSYSELEQNMLETKAVLLEIKKMIESKSEATRHASSISYEDLESLLVALRCVMIPAIDGEKDDFADTTKDDFPDTTEIAGQDNKYEPQQQEQYLAVLKNEVSGAKFMHIKVR